MQRVVQCTLSLINSEGTTMGVAADGTGISVSSTGEITVERLHKILRQLASKLGEHTFNLDDKALENLITEHGRVVGANSRIMSLKNHKHITRFPYVVMTNDVEIAEVSTDDNTRVFIVMHGARYTKFSFSKDIKASEKSADKVFVATLADALRYLELHADDLLLQGCANAFRGSKSRIVSFPILSLIRF